MTLPIFAMAFMSLIGWFFFTIFVGVGLIALPVDLINEWRTRPEPMSTKDWVEKKKHLAARAAVLIDHGRAFQDRLIGSGARSKKEQKEDKANFLKFEQNYYFLKKDFELLDLSYRLKGGNPLWYMLKLVCGVFGIVVSISWIVHISVFVLPAKPIHPFLNNMFVGLESFIPGFPLFGVVAFGLWSYYLLWCCVKGNFKLGVRFLLWRVKMPTEHLKNLGLTALLPLISSL